LNAWTNFCETWYVYHGTWAHLNGVLHKSHQSVILYVHPPIAEQLGINVTMETNAHNSRRIVRVFFCAVRVVWKEIKLLVLPRTSCLCCVVILSFHLLLGLESGVFLSPFQNKILRVFSVSSVSDPVALTTLDEEYKLWGSYRCLPSPIMLLHLFWAKFFLSTLSSDTSISFLQTRDQVVHTKQQLTIQLISSIYVGFAGLMWTE
jgi:hypothetical protein